MKGIFHPTVGAELTQTEWESETGHNLANGTSFPASPEERDLFYRTDRHAWYIFNGTDWDKINVDFFDRFREFIPWVSLDGFTVGGDTGYNVNAFSPSAVVYTGATTDYDAYLHTQEWWRKLLDAGKVIIFEFPLQFLNGNTLHNIWIRLSYSVADPPSETAHHFGWKIINAALYASNADGTTQTITDTGVTLPSAEQRTRLKIVFTPGTDCKFYVNDILKATHTTNLPTNLHYKFHVHTRTLTDATRGVLIGRILIEKENA